MKIHIYLQKLSKLGRERRERILHNCVKNPTQSGGIIAKILNFSNSVPIFLPCRQMYRVCSKFLHVFKFICKVMIWQAICDYVRKTSLGQLHGQVYNGKCLQIRIFPFIQSNKGPVRFQPDLAICHNRPDVIERYGMNIVLAQ